MENEEMRCEIWRMKKITDSYVLHLLTAVPGGLRGSRDITNV
jgi:hypothetical protein